MKLSSLSVVCLSLLLCHTHYALAKRGGGGFGRGFGIKRTSTSNRGNTNSDASNKNNKVSSPQGGHPSQGGHPPQPGRSGYPGSYPQQPGYPAGGYPAGGHPIGGGHGGPGHGYINQNPNNKVLSPHYGGSFGFGGRGTEGGSPFSQSVQAMGKYPSDRSRGFGRSAVMAAAGGAMAGMAVGYGLGRFPHPPFHFHNSEEERYYNNYMQRKYGVNSTDTNDYSRDYAYSKPPESYDRYMDSCMKRDDLLPGENQESNNTPAATTTATATSEISALDTGSNTTETNSTAADNSSTTATPTTQPLNQPGTNPLPPDSEAVASDEDNDTVSIMEIGYPALIEQMKARRCVELYMDYSEKYLMRLTDGVQRPDMGSRWLVAVVASTTLMLLNGIILTLLH